MKEYTPTQVKTLIEEEVKHSLEETLREGARHMLQVALEAFLKPRSGGETLE